jgi:intracellular septation protein
LFTNKPLLQRLGENSIQLPTRIWRQLNLVWCGFFASLGFINLYVVYNFSTSTWVNFKLFGTLGLTIVFVILQSLYMAKHAQEHTAN